MKVIDLLNKIANGEAVPKKVYVGSYYFEYEDNGEYINTENSNDLLFDFDSYYSLETCLNQEVKIIEEDKPKTLNDIRESYGLPRIEDKKIERLKDINTDYYSKELYYENLSKEEITLDIQTLKHKVNEIIDYLEENKND